MANQDKPILLIQGEFNEKDLKKKLQGQLDKVSKELKLTTSVSSSGNKALEQELKTTQRVAQARKSIRGDKLEEYRLDMVSRLKIAKMDAETIKVNTQKYSTDKKHRQELESQYKILQAINILNEDDYDTLKAKNREIQEAKKGMQNVFSEARATGRGNLEFGTMFSSALKSLTVWLSASTVFFQMFHSIKKGVSDIYELSNVMNEIRIVTGMTAEEAEKLSKEYGKVAVELGVTSKEIATLSKELYRQGLGTAEIEKRTKAIVTFSKISGLAVEQTTDLLTSSANGFEIDINRIIDSYAKVGDYTATGADEIAEGMSKVAGSAENAGVSFDKVVGMFATISAKTRESANTLGNSLVLATSCGDAC